MLLAFYTASAIIPIGVTVFMVFYLIVKKRPQVMLCTEGQQCVSVCPLLAKGCSPMDIMLAAKSGQEQEAIQKGALLCVGCGKCQRACPRGLAPYLEVEKWRNIHPAGNQEMTEFKNLQRQKGA